MDIDKFKAELTRDEGQRLFPYTDTVGKITIGVGRNLTDNGITPAECDMLLSNDIVHVISMLNQSTPWWRTLTENRQRVLANMCFNLGWPRLMLFKRMLAAMQAGDVETAAKEMLDSTWAKQVGARATRLADMWRAG
jgi:lysozyme